MRRLRGPATSEWASGGMVRPTSRGASASRRETNPKSAERSQAWAEARASAWAFGCNKQERALRLIHTLAVAGVIAAASLTPAIAIDISGAGATFPYPIYA